MRVWMECALSTGRAALGGVGELPYPFSPCCPQIGAGPAIGIAILSPVIPAQAGIQTR
ncbi:hypothetical protein [Sphingomonas sp. MA1305]|uniref:hypothetical protein n=1 Tax=Sphingomonas sp. MA1305 TaxID=2479204 RepID=UPI0018DF8E13|nr:hypothetical protein [Sphingomonas sp. MA1305]